MVRKSVITVGIVVVLLVGVAIVLGVRSAQRDAVRARTIGRLSQLHLSLANYEHQHGALPSRFARDTDGNPTHGWLASVLSQFEERAVSDKLDVTKAWDASDNVDAIKLGEQFWQWYREDGLFPCALQGDDSIWAESGSPRGTLSQFPNSIVLVAVELDDVHPLQPFAITEDHLEQLLMDGTEALFIDSNRVYGKVRIHNGAIVYER